MNVASTLSAAARAFPHHPAVTWQGTTLTYRELDDRTAALAAGFRRAGVGRGDRVALFLHNRPELLEALYATLRLGAIVVPCNARSTTDELGFVLRDSDAALVVTDEAHVAVAADAAGGARVVCTGSDLDELRRPGGPRIADEPVDAEDTAWLFYTSGTTGRPKGAMLSHRALTFMLVSWLADLTPMDEADVVLHAAPLSHGAGFHALAATARGAHHVLLDGPSFDPLATLDAIERWSVTTTWLVPTQIVLLTEALASSGRAAPSSLGTIVYGGAPIGVAALERAIAAFGPIFVQLYAQGESPMTITCLPARAHVAGRLASVGRARLGVEVRVVAADGTTAPDGEVGEVAVRGPSVMSGYWRRPDATAETVVDGWLRTGDLGRFDEHGHLFLLDRAKDLIISGGANVYAAEVEAVLAVVPGVLEVAVVGAPDDLWGERVEAVVVLEPGAELDEQLLDAACRARLAGYKVPRRYVVVDALPRNAYGKVVKRELRALVANERLTVQTESS